MHAPREAEGSIVPRTLVTFSLRPEIVQPYEMCTRIVVYRIRLLAQACVPEMTCSCWR